jgi:transcriptional regulator with XRE-family HTH domain
MDKIAFGEYLRKVLDEYDLTQSTVARALNCTPNTVNKWLQGVNGMSAAHIRKFCHVFQIREDTIRKIYAFTDYIYEETHTQSLIANSSRKLIYESGTEAPPFAGWERYSSVGGHHERIKVIRRQSDRLAAFELRAFAGEDVGVNKDISAVAGFVQFEYRVFQAQPSNKVISFFVIPIRKLWKDTVQYVEFGSELEKPFSYRRGRNPQVEEIGDNQWHPGEIEFDFREVADVVHCIFGPRINEASSVNGSAHVQITNIRFSI